MKDNPWPPSSPDLNPLDFWFWGVAEEKVMEETPTALDKVKTVVEKLTREMESDVLMKVADHFSRRAEFCVQEKVILNTY